MTDEELDQARADEAWRLHNSNPSNGGVATIAARLAREGWTPVDPLVIEAREIIAKRQDSRGYHDDAARYRSGDYDQDVASGITLAALKRGIEIGKEQSK